MISLSGSEFTALVDAAILTNSLTEACERNECYPQTQLGQSPGTG